MDRPEPPPKLDGMPVSPALISFIKNSDMKQEDKQKVIELIEQRCDYGLKKYGQQLMSEDGRDDVVDAMQEAGDLIQYAFKAGMNKRMGELRVVLIPVLEILNKLLESCI